MGTKSLEIIQLDGTIRDLGVIDILDVTRLELILHAQDRTGLVILSNGLDYRVTEDTVRRIFRHEEELIEFNKGNVLIYWISSYDEIKDQAYKENFRRWAFEES